MSAVLTDNLPLLAGAPNGIKKLRELILQLAVLGKLVESSDQLWTEMLLGDLGAWGSGGTPPKTHREYYGGDIPWLVIGDLNDGLVTCAETSITEEGLANSSAKIVPAGTVLIAMYGSIGKLGIAGMPCATNQAIAHCRANEAVVRRDFLFLLLRSMREGLLDRGQGLAQQNISQRILKSVLVKVPPIEEQIQIETKVDELMALCDRLEARQADADSAHAQLVQALLSSLTQANDAEDFSQSWQRLSEHFHTLFTTESSIDALKQTLLQLAVMGKLVPQDPSDEPARELLKSIRLERQAAIFGRNKLEKLSSSDTEDELSFRLPSQWSLARLGELVISGPSNGNSPKPVSVETPYRCLTLSATTRGTFNNQCYKFVDIDADTASKYFLKEGDLLIQRANSIDYVGVSAVYNGPDDQFIFPDLMMRLRVSQYLNLPFIHAYLSSITGRAYFRSHASGTQGNMPKINQGTVVNAPIPIPPLAEQHRIVAKIDQLMALCDQLKARLNQARQVHEHLASALVEQAVA
ncbi:TPA: restriction endonuclease subunit S [Pseudomonas putida]|uniref:restriction endonuclease subunit S n=1 Tax=Pseudomonas TaxID=286 RepID=UPI000B3BF7C1|nr:MULTISPECIES: restriction endonuclease subunit S [Pseudomonas]MDN5520519.1 restriction endonuclease subunit S [Pseudomonas sp.]MDN5533898.1 restriction endonuclease subunit S [Pseudomonas sp.]OUS80007.1 hypothetical protein CBP05_22430 [Pseudomonas putida]OUS84230.1 hypothetical protein CBP06_22810 [Pseudomonas putida]